MKPTDTIKEGNKSHDDYINHRMGELKDTLRKLAESFLKFLFAAHSGGIIAVAGIVKVQGAAAGTFTKVSLTCFVIGLLVTAILILKMLFRMYAVDKAWHENSNLWYKGQISWGELNERDDLLVEDDKSELSMAVISFIIVLIGAACAVSAIWLGNG